MKKFNLKLHTSFLFTILILQGCMPDSLTKFKKDAPKKAEDVVEPAIPAKQEEPAAEEKSDEE